MKLEKITINRKHEMFWNNNVVPKHPKLMELTVNMKCFEINLSEVGRRFKKN